jgi:tetratricopeptide (TPR) repeat protein/predicted Ser/Thr protein kinase
LGAGGMGEVYLAEDARLGRKIALKVLAEGLADDEHKRRFIQEAKAASALNHPSIITIYDIGSEGGRDFIAMEYVEGETLRERLSASGPFSLKPVAEIGGQLASALARAHDAGIIHRDLKPENIMLRPDGIAKVLDFGLAKLAEARKQQTGSEAETAMMTHTSPGLILGTPRYMSPEQVRGERADHRSDIFSLGGVLYEMATNRAPFAGETMVDTMHAILHVEPRPLAELVGDASPELQRIINKCLAKDPADRYQHTDDIEVDLRQLRLSIESGRHQVVSAAVAQPSASVFQSLLSSRLLLIAVLYVVAAWGIRELVDWLVNRYVWSPHLVDLVFVALASLVPTVVLLASSDQKQSPSRLATVKRLGVPANVVVAAVLLSVLFHGKELGAATKTIMVQNEEGRTIQRVIPKSEFRRRVAFFFFDNKSGDDALDWLQFATSEMLAFDLTQDLFLDVRSAYGFHRKMKEAGFANGVGLPLTLKQKIADESHMTQFVAGSFTKQSGEYVVRVSLYETASGRLLSERDYLGGDVFSLVDQISGQLKRDLTIPEQHIRETKNLPVAEILTSSPTALRLYVDGSHAAVFDNDWGKAADLLERAVQADPTFAMAYYQLQLTYVFTNQGQKREPTFQLLMQHLYKLPERLQYAVKSDYYIVKQDPDRQLRVVKMWAEVYPSDLSAHRVLAMLYMYRNQLNEAIAEYKLILDLDPEQHDALQTLAALHKKKGEYDQALAYAQQYANRFPNKPESWEDIGWLHQTLGQYEQAKSYYEKALLIEPDRVSTLVALGDIEARTAHFDQALRQYEEALSASKTPEQRAEVYSSLEWFYDLRGQIGKALDYQRQRFSEMEKAAPPMFVLIEKLESLNKYVKAGQADTALRMIRSIEAQLGPPLDELVPLGYLMIYLELEDADNAEKAVAGVEAFINTFKVEALRPIAVRGQAKIQELRGQYAQAISLYQQQQELDPTDATINTDIGRCYRKLKDFAKAEEYLRQALKVYPFDPETHYELALVYSDQGNKTKALEHLKTALDVWKEADPEYKPARLAREKLAQLESTS